MIIYRAINKVNGKCYVGQTRHSLEERRTRHLHCAEEGVETHFYQAIRKYGSENFEWEIICSAKDKQTLNELETYYITKFDSIKNGYNMVDGGENNVMDIESVKTKHAMKMSSDEVRSKISTSMKKLRAEKGFSEETRKRISEKLKGNHNFGKCDTRSIACYCIDTDGTRYDFNSYKDAGIWWFTKYKPFGDVYHQVTYQRKIIMSIELGYCTYGRNFTQIVVDSPKWYRKESD